MYITSTLVATSYASQVQTQTQTQAVLSSTLVGTSFAQKSSTNTFSGPPPPGNGIAIAQQPEDVLTGLSVGKDRAMYVTFKIGVGKWSFF